ncbi:MAG: uroporphyrinogen decarboxylase family protein [Candidatus Hodarchaeales archaeon]|jgi:uroporphyrinogen-III decarboxylase
MNSRELTLSAIKGVPEKIPFNPFIMHLAASFIDVDYSKIYCQKANVLAEAQIKCANFFGIDHVCVSTDAYREASAWGVEIDFNGHTPAPVAGTELKIEEFDSVEEPELLSASRVQDRIKAVQLLNEKTVSDQCVVGWIEAPFAELCCIFGMTTIMCLGGSDWEKNINILVERIIPIQLEFAKLQIEAGADIIGAGDSAISQIGPKNYETGTFKVTRDLFRTIEKHVPVLYHTCGNNSLIDKQGRDMIELIARAGESILDIDYQVDLRETKAKIGDEVCIRGNSNNNVLGTPHTAEEVVKEVVRTIEAGKPGGMYMYAAGCEFPWEPLDMAIRNLSIAKALNEKLGVY